MGPGWTGVSTAGGGAAETAWPGWAIAWAGRTGAFGASGWAPTVGTGAGGGDVVAGRAQGFGGAGGRGGSVTGPGCAPASSPPAAPSGSLDMDDLALEDG